MASSLLVRLQWLCAAHQLLSQLAVTEDAARRRLLGTDWNIVCLLYLPRIIKGRICKADNQPAGWLLLRAIFYHCLESLQGLQKAQQSFNSIGCWLSHCCMQGGRWWLLQSLLHCLCAVVAHPRHPLCSCHLLLHISGTAICSAGRGRQVIAVCKSADLLLMVLDASKPDFHKDILTRELESVGLRLNRCVAGNQQMPPDVGCHFGRHFYTGEAVLYSISPVGPFLRHSSRTVFMRGLTMQEGAQHLFQEEKDGGHLLQRNPSADSHG